MKNSKIEGKSDFRCSGILNKLFKTTEQNNNLLDR
jgi:hypothetical protein